MRKVRLFFKLKNLVVAYLQYLWRELRLLLERIAIQGMQ